MYIQNKQNSSKFKCCSPLQLSCNLTGKCHVVGYYSYTHRLYHIKERNAHINNTIL